MRVNIPFRRTSFAFVLASGLLPALASAQSAPNAPVETVSSGPVQAVIPEGNAQPARAATAAQIAPKETFTAAQLHALRSAPSLGPKGAGTSGPLAPPTSAVLNFNGTSQTQSLRPPDTHGAVGASQFVEVTNSKFEVFNKLTGALQKSVTLNSFCGYTAQTIFDPRVVYDKIWNRWIVVAEAFKESATSQILCLAVSLTSNANGGFFIYRFQAPRGDANNFFDYPQLGMDQDAIIITANIFNSSDVYQFSFLFAVAKADLYNGRGFSVPVFNAGASGTLAPPIVETNDSNVLVLTANYGTTVGLRKFTQLGRSGATFFSSVNVTVPSYATAPSARQPGTTNRLDVLNRFVDHSSQISNHVLNVTTLGSGSFPIPRWFQINGITNTLATAGFFFESSDSDDFNPSIAGSFVGGTASNPIGRMFFTWTSTDALNTGQHNARVKGSGRLATDSTTTIGGLNFFTSATFYNPSADLVERWGDYSSTTLDPTAVAGCPAGQRAYIVNEKNNSATVWGSRFGRMGFC